MKPTEYDVVFGIKEWLLEHDWAIVGFNPPGAQGTFSIPNPSKDPRYKGQAGTESPDLIAVKRNHVLIVECKDIGKSRIMKDVEKIYKLVLNKKRMDLLDRLVRNMCLANNINIADDFHKIIAIGYGGKLILTEVTERSDDVKTRLGANDKRQIQTFYIEITDPHRNIRSMRADADPTESINLMLYPTDCDIKEILLCGGTGETGTRRNT